MKDIKGIGKALFRPDEEKLRYNKEQKAANFDNDLKIFEDDELPTKYSYSNNNDNNNKNGYSFATVMKKADSIFLFNMNKKYMKYDLKKSTSITQLNYGDGVICSNKVDGNYNDHKMVLTGKKYAERMLLNNDHKLMTPLFNKPTTPKPMHLIMVNDNNMGDET
ncbi:hypothetical protein PV328_004008 [Microctonus aethiopoides]|uniref:Uncharacterized protein n=1 Tax=Microctonus aethiopoides TaxID=144406 RepID=A0AA39F9Q0_9HYME|nr:hypothetical protein PV328_004008 [Microctonus aethiopoides]